MKGCAGEEGGAGADGTEEGVFGEIYQVLKKGEYYYGQDPRNHGMKMRWLLNGRRTGGHRRPVRPKRALPS
jgi:hypothetical protein